MDLGHMENWLSAESAIVIRNIWKGSRNIPHVWCCEKSHLLYTVQKMLVHRIAGVARSKFYLKACSVCKMETEVGYAKREKGICKIETDKVMMVWGECPRLAAEEY